MDTPLDYTNLPFAIRWVGKSNADGKIKLSFQFVVPKGVLQIGNVNSNDLDLSLAAAAFEKDGKPAGNFSKDLSGVLPAETIAQLAEKGFFWDGSMQVDASATMVRFVIRDNTTGKLGSLSVPVNTP
ncbi:MAG: hypothetical protein ACJ71N_08775 [Terriglobales bacterium]|jgi:hypothetical protein